ncbi:MAG TPA: choice-of-anchor D domain-containing protein, partial [Candidatus Methylomirabilis sp.]|nr:choice-of-anchor D domain-containing protein [Candidatus Methylomirabilis sp.]
MAGAFAAALGGVRPAFAQFQQPLVFSSAGAIAVRNDQTGALTAVSGSPFAAAQSQFALDVQGRFLFSLGTNSIHMYQITSNTTGAYQEVAHSPFSSANTNQPTFIAVEPTGNFIAVVNRVGLKPGDASVETFQISPNAAGGPALIPVPGSATELDSTPAGVAEPPNDKEFLIFLGPNPQSSNSTIRSGSEFQTLTIDSQTGLIAGLQTGNATSERGDSFAMDPQGRYCVLGTQDAVLEVGHLQVIGIAGQLPSTNFSLPQSNFPEALWIDSTGSFLYVGTSDLANPIVVNIYSVNLQTAQLTETTSSPLPSATAVPPYAPDPTGSFDYGFGSDANTAIAYTVDPLTGYFIQTSNSPFTILQIAGSLTFSIPPGQQGISGPAALLSSTSLSFGNVQTGTSSPPQSFTLTSNGGQALSATSISLSGPNPSQFQESDTCQIPSVLQPSKFCSISITFAPTSTGTGAQQATVVVTDNAPDSPQSVQLSGTGVAAPPPAPAVTAAPNPVSFPTIAQGTTSSAITVNVTNSGNATLHITSVTLGGNNASDFSMTTTCNGAYAANSGCSITLTFTPLAAGQRSAAVTITDDAPNSPQSISVNGTATPAQPTTPLVTFSTTTLGFGAITQGTASSPQAVTVTNSGGGALHIVSVVLAGANPTDFSLSNGCTASSYAVNASCVLTVSFAPLSTGARAAAITLTDDASNSPQTIALNGSANLAVTIGPAPGGSTAATVTAGQTAQYNLQLTPGPGFSGTVTLTCSGAPVAATCSVPVSVQVSSPSPAPFALTVATTGAGAIPIEFSPRSMPLVGWRFVLTSVVGILLLFAMVV